MSGYLVPAGSLQVEEVIKNSRFITRVINATSVEQAKDFLRQLRQDEPDATHHCWAHIVGDPNSTTLLGCSDDGEPAGTAGKPMLNVLQHSGVGDIMVVCTRYYGGTKLGTGGLARAYGGGVKLALEQLETTQKIEKVLMSFTAEYECVKDLEHEFKQVDAEIEDVEYQSKVLFRVRFPQEKQPQLINQIKIRFGDKVTWNIMQS